jgi:hypothetical protein
MYIHTHRYFYAINVCVGTATFPAAPAFMTPRQRVIN